MTDNNKNRWLAVASTAVGLALILLFTPTSDATKAEPVVQTSVTEDKPNTKCNGSDLLRNADGTLSANFGGACGLPRRMAEWRSHYEEAKESNISRAVFTCNYTTRTCLRGYSYRSGLDVLQILAEDRTTVLEHLFCTGAMCYRVEPGRITYRTKDMGEW